MLVSYKGKIILSLIMIVLDGIIVYYNDYYFNNLSIFYPMLMVSLIPFLFNSSLKEYYQISFIMGIIYDLLYSNIFLYNGFLFLLLSKIDVKIMKYLKNNLFLYMMLVIINIIFYDTISFLLIKVTNYQIVTFSDLIYKIENSLLLNIMSSFVFFFLVKKKMGYHKM